MKLLILGGTVFLGRHLVDAALDRGHEPTLFNRGRTNPELFRDLERIRGDRGKDLSALGGRHWDAVIDPSGYVPRVVEMSANAVSTNHYTFISSLSVFAEFDTPDQDESAPVGTLVDPATEEIDAETYGPLKAACERAAEAARPGRTLVIRPGLIVGPHDPSDRFTYWPCRMARGGRVLAPGRLDEPVQFVDVRDLADWIIQCVEDRRIGIYNATGPERILTHGEFFEACQSVTGIPSELVWMSDEFLLRHGVGAYREMPLWVPAREGAGFHRVNCTKAIRAGLCFRSLEHTIGDTLAWWNERGGDASLSAGLSPERETALLDAWVKESSATGT
jgi:2'-hydroxyisoflavone reductase